MLAAKRPEHKWRIGSEPTASKKGYCLAYIDARHVMVDFDEVFGPENWEDSYVETPTGRVICTITVETEFAKRVSKSDGAGDTKVEGEKGAISDAFKRAAVKFGYCRHLYEMPQMWISLEEYNGKFNGKSVRYNLTEWCNAQGKQAEKPKLENKPQATDERTALVAEVGKMVELGFLTQPEIVDLRKDVKAATVPGLRCILDGLNETYKERIEQTS